MVNNPIFQLLKKVLKKKKFRPMSSLSTPLKFFEFWANFLKIWVGRIWWQSSQWVSFYCPDWIYSLVEKTPSPPPWNKISLHMACQRHANWQKNSSKVRDKWQRIILGMPIYTTFGSPLFLLPRIYVPDGKIVFHGAYFDFCRFIRKFPKINQEKFEHWDWWDVSRYNNEKWKKSL